MLTQRNLFLSYKRKLKKENKRRFIKNKMPKTIMKQKVCSTGCSCGTCGCAGAVYGLGFIGALVYYLATATGFWDGVLGVLKAIVWPAFLVFELLKSLGM